MSAHLILGSFSPKNFGPKNVVFHKPFCDFTADISRLEQDTVTGKRACLANLMNFGPHTEKMGPFFNPLKINFCER